MADKDIPVMVPISPTLLKALDDFRRDRPDLPERYEAIRRLLDIALVERWKWRG